MADWTIELLSKHHDRIAFACGVKSLDDFLRLRASQYDKRRLGRTHIAVQAGSVRIAGFYTLAAGSLDVSDFPEADRRKLPKHRIPTIHLGRLAVDQAYRGQRLGETLLFHAFQTALELTGKMGAHVVGVRAIDENALAFYRKYGFLALVDNPHHLFLPMKAVEAIISSGTS